MSAAATDVVARLAGVGLSYGKTRALEDITLDFPAGCIVGLIGPDGVGKSSLLALIAGARALQDGRLQVLGGDMASARIVAGSAHVSPICRRGWAKTCMIRFRFLKTWISLPVCLAMTEQNAIAVSQNYCWLPGLPPMQAVRSGNCQGG